MTSSTQIKIVTSSTARAVHISTQREDGTIDFPICGAPGNTPDAARKFRPQIVHDDIDVTCKRCIAIDAARTATLLREQRIAEQKRFERISVVDAREGDEVFQAGEWVPVKSVTPMRSSSNVHIEWLSGGSHNAPAHHFSARRRLDAIADVLDGATLPELDDDAIEAEELAQITFERDEREQMISDVRDSYGDEAAQLLVDGWTLDGALAHVDGSCDVTICTHPSHSISEAEVMGRVTGSRAATVTHERRLLSGELVTESVEQWNADETIGAPDEEPQDPGYRREPRDLDWSDVEADADRMRAEHDDALTDVLVIKIAVSGDAMESDAPHELQKLLDDVLRKIVSEGHESSRLLDTNGGTIGSFSIERMSVDAATKIEG
jgi:hypothetical protein